VPFSTSLVTAPWAFSCSTLSPFWGGVNREEVLRQMSHVAQNLGASVVLLTHASWLLEGWSGPSLRSRTSWLVEERILDKQAPVCQIGDSFASLTTAKAAIQASGS
jgi:hypothetical protein